jgi:hypothetical protein
MPESREKFKDDLIVPKKFPGSTFRRIQRRGPEKDERFFGGRFAVL